MKDETPKPVKVFALAAFLHDVGGDAVRALWPIFLTSTLHLSPKLIGLVDGIGDACVYIAQGVFGFISDRVRKRKVFVWVGYLCGGMARVGYGFVSSVATVIPLRILDRGGKLRSAPRDAIVAEVSKNGTRGRNFGIVQAFDNMGAIAGVLFALVFYETLDIRVIFLLAAIPSIAAVALVHKYIKESHFVSKRIPRVTLADFDTNFRMYLAASGVMSLAVFSYSFLVIFAGQHGFETHFLPVLYLVYSFTSGVAAYFFGLLVDKKGPKLFIIVGIIFWICACLCFLIDQSKVMIIFGMILFGLHEGTLVSSVKTMTSQIAPQKHLTAALGGYDLIAGLCTLPASMIAGFLWEYFGSPVPMLYFGVFTSFIALILFVHVKENVSKPVSA